MHWGRKVFEHFNFLANKDQKELEIDDTVLLSKAKFADYLSSAGGKGSIVFLWHSISIDLIWERAKRIQQVGYLNEACFMIATPARSGIPSLSSHP